jgi:3-methyladenine DNA glycosylase AlkD
MTTQQRFSVSGYVTAIEAEFSRHTDAKQAAGAKAYVRDQFDYYGMSTPKRRLVEKAIHANHPLPPLEALEKIIKALWKKPQRELQYFAMELCYRYKKQFPREFIALFEWMITTKSWWETVDFIAPKLVAEYFRLYPETITGKTNEWMKSGNIWLMRTALIFQNLHKKKTDEKLLFSLILKCKDHPDFFIRKGIGWALRQYARTNPAAVKKFVTQNKLSPLSEKEALKHV